MSKPTDDELRALALALLERGRPDATTGEHETDVDDIAAHLGWSRGKVRRVTRELARSVPSTWLEPPRWQFWRRRRP
jgi:hypothetical protein